MEITYPTLAIDYGDKHFGLAISDTNGIIASPLEVISKSKNRNTENVIEDIIQICEEYRIKSILIGEPQEFEKTYTRTTKKIDGFISKLKHSTDIPIYKYDESFSTTQAQNMLTSSGQNTKQSRRKIDKIAATVFLQEFLNSKNQKNEK